MSIFGKIKKIFSKKPALPAEVIAEYEEALINADASLAVVKQIITPELKKLESAAEVEEKITASILEILQKREKKFIIDEENTHFPITEEFKTLEEVKELEEKSPYVIFVAGVNGSGKTTTIGKLAHKLVLEGRKVLIGACDTFRAAATEQLEHWALQAGAEIEKPLKEKEDPSAVCYRSFKRAVQENFDCLIIDTSGRLQGNKTLMDELKKTQSVLKKLDETKPDLTLLVLDGSVGQNAISQAKEFAKFIEIDGLCITKLDSSSKGGALISLASELPYNIYFASMGEGIDDLADFNSEEFIKNIFED